MADLFPTAFSFIMRPENDGQGYHDTPGDAGGPTAWGVTAATWRHWLAIHGSIGAEVPTSKEAAAPLYRSQFWNACRCPNLGPCGIAVFDMAVTAGPSGAARILQGVLGLPEDGDIGPKTVGAAQRLDNDVLNKRLLLAREVFYGSLDQPEFLHGWIRRAIDCHVLVTGLIK
jgi:lysozyme family protein